MQDDPFPRGFGAKFNPSDAGDRHLFGHNSGPVPFVVVKFHRSKRFVKVPRWGLLSPEQNLYLVTYEKDDHIVGRTPSDEVDRVEELEDVLQGAFLGDRFTYEGMNRRDLATEIDESVQRQLAANRLLEERGIDVPQYPCIMGWKPWHYERCRILLDEISTSVGFDATQYNSKYKLTKDVRCLDDVLSPERIFVNGRVSPDWLRMLPKTVVACSGAYNIREECKDANGTPSRENLPNVAQKRVNALNSWQSDINEFL